jgi:hypothetical protein
MDTGESAEAGGTTLYRVEIEGPLPDRSARRFDAERVEPAGSNTRLQLRVADQAELLGRVRRIHDLNLRLVSLHRVSDPGT